VIVYISRPAGDFICRLSGLYTRGQLAVFAQLRKYAIIAVRLGFSFRALYVGKKLDIEASFLVYSIC
jgi:hypothetical protein